MNFELPLWLMMDHLILPGINIEEYKGFNIKITNVCPKSSSVLIIGSILCHVSDHPYQAWSIKNWQSSIDIDIKATLEFQGTFLWSIWISPTCISWQFPNLEVFVTHYISNDRQSNDEFVLCSWAHPLLELSFLFHA